MTPRASRCWPLGVTVPPHSSLLRIASSGLTICTGVSSSRASIRARPGDAEGAVLSNDQVGLPAACRIDDVEHRPAHQCIGCGGLLTYQSCGIDAMRTSNCRGVGSITRSMSFVARGWPWRLLASEPETVWGIPADDRSWTSPREERLLIPQGSTSMPGKAWRKSVSPMARRVAAMRTTRSS